MKSPAPLVPSLARLALGAFCYSAFALSSHAAVLYWDTSADATDSTFGGNGTWSTSDLNWNSTAANNDGAGVLQGWTGGFADSARFLRTLNADVAVSGTVEVNSINFGFSTGSYITGSGSVANLTGGTLDLRTTNGGVVLQTLNGATANIGGNINLFGGGVATQAIRSTSGLVNITGNVADISGSGTRTLALESFGGALTIDGNITRSGTAVIALSFGGGSGTTQANNGVYTLGGNNSGIVGTAMTLSRGSLVINNGAATGTASGITVANANTTAVAGDTARVLVGTAGVTMTRNVTFTALTTTDTNDIRAIGGLNTTGTSAFSATITVNAMAASGTGAYAQFTSEAGGRVNFTGSINGSGAIRKVGDGVVAFSRPNAGTNHSGGVTVAAGTLLANGFNSTGSSAVSVSSGATLGGNGTVAGAITLAAGARLSPGDFAGDNSTSLAGTFTGGSSLTWNSNDTTGGMLFTLGVDQSSSDQIVLSGAFTKGAGSVFLFDFAGSTFNPSISYTLMSFGSTDFDIGDFAALNGDNAFGFAFDGNTLTYAAIPEPSTAALLVAFGALAVVGLRRRRA